MPFRRTRRSALLVAALFAVLLATPGAGFALPIADSTVDLSDPKFLFLDFDLADGFTINFSPSWVDYPFNGTVGQRFHIDATLTLDVPAELEADYLGGLMVFTSIRENNSSPLDCGDPNTFPARLPFSMVNMQGDTLSATDLSGPAGQLCDVEDSLGGFLPPFGAGVQFQAFQFGGNPGDTHQISFDVQVNEEFSVEELNAFLNTGIVTPFRGFAITPEPSTVLLVFAGMGALALGRRPRKN